MRLHQAAQDAGSAPSSTAGDAPFTAGPVVLFIAAVLIAGMTCILYLWQQSRIVAGQQDILALNQTLTQLTQQKDDLIAQEDSLRSVPNIVAHATQYGMMQSPSAHYMKLTAPAAPPTPMIAQATGDRQPAVILPATNAAITSWWENAWDSLYNLLQ